jgi:cytidylate kinase
MTALAIDGPAGAGKSTVARAVADALGWDYIDSGAMYRAVALAALDAGIDLDDADAISDLAESVTVSNDGNVTTVEGVDVSDRIRSPEVSAAAAIVARYPRVRKALVNVQRDAAERSPVVMEGRDIGTKVFPDADVKVFLTAALDERARRRARDLGAPDEELATVREQISDRDDTDVNRATAPLVEAPDAVVIDTTDKTISEVVEAIVSLVEQVSR